MLAINRLRWIVDKKLSIMSYYSDFELVVLRNWSIHKNREKKCFLRFCETGIFSHQGYDIWRENIKIYWIYPHENTTISRSNKCGFFLSIWKKCCSSKIVQFDRNWTLGFKCVQFEHTINQCTLKNGTRFIKCGHLIPFCLLTKCAFWMKPVSIHADGRAHCWISCQFTGSVRRPS